MLSAGPLSALLALPGVVRLAAAALAALVALLLAWDVALGLVDRETAVALVRALVGR